MVRHASSLTPRRRALRQRQSRLLRWVHKIGPSADNYVHRQGLLMIILLHFLLVQYPFVPAHITKPKECKKLFLVQMPERSATRLLAGTFYLQLTIYFKRGPCCPEEYEAFSDSPLRVVRQCRAIWSSAFRHSPLAVSVRAPLEASLISPHVVFRYNFIYQ